MTAAGFAEVMRVFVDRWADPVDLPLGDLAEMLRDIEAALLGIDEAVAPGAPKMVLALVGLTGSGLRPAIGAREIERADVAARRWTRAVCDGRVATLPDKSRRATQRLEDFAVKRGANLRLVANPDSGGAAVEACIKADRSQGAARVEGETTLYGRVIRVGGDKPKAKVIFDDGLKMTCDVITREVAREMATRLYQTVGLTGDAVWDGRQWSLESFLVREVLVFEEASLSDAFQRVADAGLDTWADVDDVVTTVQELRADGDAP